VGNDFERDIAEILLYLGVLELAANQTFRGKDGVLAVDDSLPPGGLSDQTFTILSEGNNGRGSAGTFRIFKNLGLATFVDGDTRVGSSEIDTDDGSGYLAAVEALGGECLSEGCSSECSSDTVHDGWMFLR